MNTAVLCLDSNSICGVDKDFFYTLGLNISLFTTVENSLSSMRSSLKFAFEISDAVCVLYSKESWSNLQKTMLMEFERSSVFVNSEKPYVIANGFQEITNGIYFDYVYNKPFLLLPKDLERSMDIEPLDAIFKSKISLIGVFNKKIESKYTIHADEVETILLVDSIKLNDAIKSIDKKQIYTTKGETPQQALFKLLKEKDATVATAESCTAGLISAKIADIPGSSSYFMGGCVTYSNEFKNRFLGVNSNTLNNFGAVSKEVAVQMALGALSNGKTNYSVAVTGIAGPDGGTKDKPVGLVYTAVASRNNVAAEKRIFSGNRRIIREKTAKFALLYLREFILLQ